MGRVGDKADAGSSIRRLGDKGLRSSDREEYEAERSSTLCSIWTSMSSAQLPSLMSACLVSARRASLFVRAVSHWPKIKTNPYVQ